MSKSAKKRTLQTAREWFNSPDGREQLKSAMTATLKHIAQLNESRCLSPEELHAPFTL